ncbi:hypothetical protein H5410_019956 [Solanum commersonii]|uniref:Binding protein n=1 Tax=Solanum commersonii TaxID=4109 RepID=A0A9J5Z6P5_SOLCO|nr:hypothetical protein H5410_019956 [Solanum commersonii]
MRWYIHVGRNDHSHSVKSVSQITDKVEILALPLYLLVQFFKSCILVVELQHFEGYPIYNSFAKASIDTRKAMSQFSFTSSSSSNFTLFYHSQNHNPSKFHVSAPFRTSQPSPSHPILPPLCSREPSSSLPLLEEKPETSQSSSKFDPQDGLSYNEEVVDEISTTKKSLEELLVVRRPVKDPYVENDDEKGEAMSNFEDSQERNDLLEEQPSSSSFPLDAGLKKFAKKVPIFEPSRLESDSGEKPLKVNLDLALYKAKILGRKFQYTDAEKILQQCIDVWPEDGRSYVALGKILSKQSKLNEARTVYEKGCQATQGENPYIWQKVHQTYSFGLVLGYSGK